LCRLWPHGRYSPTDFLRTNLASQQSAALAAFPSFWATVACRRSNLGCLTPVANPVRCRATKHAILPRDQTISPSTWPSFCWSSCALQIYLRSHINLIGYARSFRFNGNYAPIVKQTDTATHRIQFLLNSIASAVVGGINNVGGANALSASSFPPISDLQRNYFGA
jgi:hypothetical protein